MLWALAQDSWGNDMSGIEPILIGAAIGGGTSAIMGGDPLQGALLGAAGGGLGGLAGGAGGAASGAAGGAGAASGAAGAGTTVGLTGGTAGSIGAAQAFPVAAQAPIVATPLSTGGAVAGNLLADMSAMDAAMAATGEGFAQTAGMGAGLFDKLDPMTMMQMGGSLLGDGKSQQQRIASSGSVRRGQAPQVQAPIDELMRLQMMAQRQRRPISLL